MQGMISKSGRKKGRAERLQIEGPQRADSPEGGPGLKIPNNFPSRTPLRVSRHFGWPRKQVSYFA